MECDCNSCRFNRTLSALILKIYNEYENVTFSKIEFRKVLSSLIHTRVDCHMAERYWKAAQKNNYISITSGNTATLSEHILISQGNITIRETHKRLSHRCPICNGDFSSDGIVKKHLINVHNFSEYHARYLLNMVERDL